MLISNLRNKIAGDISRQKILRWVKKIPNFSSIFQETTFFVSYFKSMKPHGARLF
jgi:hypothetical protein